MMVAGALRPRCSKALAIASRLSRLCGCSSSACRKASRRAFSPPPLNTNAATCSGLMPANSFGSSSGRVGFGILAALFDVFDQLRVGANDAAPLVPSLLKVVELDRQFGSGGQHGPGFNIDRARQCCDTGSQKLFGRGLGATI